MGSKSLFKFLERLPEVARVGEISVLHAGKVDERISKAVVDQLSILAERYPGVAERLPRVTIVGEDAGRKLRRIGSGKAGLLGRGYSDDIDHLNEMLGGGPGGPGMFLFAPQMKSHWAEMSSGKTAALMTDHLPVRGVEDIASMTASHEFGHFAHGQLGNMFERASGLPDYRAKLTRDLSFHWPGEGQGWKSWANTVGSDYARENEKEAFGELFMHMQHTGVQGRVASNIDTALRTNQLTPDMQNALEARVRGFGGGRPVGGPEFRRHSTARNGLPVRSSAPARFRIGRQWSQ